MMYISTEKTFTIYIAELQDLIMTTSIISMMKKSESKL